MAEIARQAPPSGTRPATTTPPIANRVTLSLPTAPSEPSKHLGDYHWLIYGEKKIGKTSLASRFPDALFFMFEPGGKALRIYQTSIDNWAMFKAYLKLLYSEKKFKTVVIDTVDIAYEMCFDHVCRQRGVNHPNEANDFGGTWRAVDDEFRSVMNQLLKSGRGVIFISHATEKEFMERDGGEYSKLIPTAANKARTYLAGSVDIIGFYGYYGKERWLTIRGSENVEAGTRTKEMFLTPDGQRVRSIPMGNDEDDAYDAITNAFANKQDFTGENLGEAGGMASIKKPKPREKQPKG